MSCQEIEEAICHSLNTYFEDLAGVEPTNLYALMLASVEKPLLTVVLERSGSNQSRAAQWLGLNRNTLHKKLVQHGLVQER